MTIPKTIAFGGTIGAYSDLACRAVFPGAAPLPCATFEEAFAAVTGGAAEFAMIPVENAIAGRVADVYHLLPGAGLFIIGEHYQPVQHHLLALPGTRLADIKIVTSHIQALSQCRAYIRAQGWRAVEHADTAGAAADLAQNRAPATAVIASALAGELYGLESLAADIADMKGNTTRFLILAREELRADPGAPCMTSLIFRTRSVPAALYKALGGFATNGVNLTKIESYLVGGNFSAAQFYTDVEGHEDEPAVRGALKELRFFAEEVKILGSYPAHEFRRRV